MKCPIKIAVTGAAGQIAYALLFRIANGDLFGDDTPVELNLLELVTALPALRGVVMELEDCAFPLLKSVSITADPVAAFEDVDWAFLVGSVPRKAGMERGDLLKINGNIFIDQGKALDISAKKDSRILVVGNPCNTNAYIAKAVARRIPHENFFAMTMLDENRAKALVAIKSGVPVTEVRNMAIWGNHSATQYPDIEHSIICGRPAKEVIQDEGWIKACFIKSVQNRGAEIIKIRGVSSAASASNAILDTARKLTYPTESGLFFSAAVSSDGSYGVPPGLMFSFPIRWDGIKWRIVQGLEHSDFAKEKLKITEQELLAERDAVTTIFKGVF